MDATDPYELPYPECDPPLTKDSSDIAQMRDLAEAIDAQVTALFNEADDEFISPDAAKIAATGGGTVTPGQILTFGTTQFDNTPGAVMAEATGIRIRQSGFYFVAGWINTNSSTTDFTRLKLNVVGSGQVLNEGIGFGAGAGNQMTGSVILPLSAGQKIQMEVAIQSASTTLNGATLAAVRITGSA